MKKYVNILTPVAILCFAGSLAIHGAMILVTVLTGAHIGGNLPVTYMEFLNLPLMSVALPVVGMTLFAIALPGVVKQRRTVELAAVVEQVVKSTVVEEKHHDDQHLKAA